MLALPRLDESAVINTRIEITPHLFDLLDDSIEDGLHLCLMIFVAFFFIILSVILFIILRLETWFRINLWINVKNIRNEKRNIN